jgi:RNA polymerase sigma-70 factor (ECF subfamily)
MAAVPEGAVVSTLGFDLANTVARAQGGDQVAFDAIYDRFADALFRYLYMRCTDTMLAEELTSDLWVRVVERLPAFRFPGGDPEAAFAGWLYRIARNLVINNYRRKRNMNVPLTETLSARDTPPDERVIAGDDRWALQAAIEKLTAEQRRDRPVDRALGERGQGYAASCAEHARADVRRAARVARLVIREETRSDVKEQ